MVSSPERREHHRLAINLPLECSVVDADGAESYRTVVTNVSSSGLYFEADRDEFRAGMLLNLELTVPPGDGHFPYPGRVRGLGEVVRVQELPEEPVRPGVAVRIRRYGIATNFRTPLKLVFQPER
ncbi:MAG TPA: PilZ domain-containing protein [Phycisphaerae bacterium]|nr:PilZ domain-containing protein [Phycisphaerae bacterium]